jgi:hypothetical protein
VVGDGPRVQTRLVGDGRGPHPSAEQLRELLAGGQRQDSSAVSRRTAAGTDWRLPHQDEAPIGRLAGQQRMPQPVEGGAQGGPGLKRPVPSAVALVPGQRGGGRPHPHKRGGRGRPDGPAMREPGPDFKRPQAGPNARPVAGAQAAPHVRQCAGRHGKGGCDLGHYAPPNHGPRPDRRHLRLPGSDGQGGYPLTSPATGARRWTCRTGPSSEEGQFLAGSHPAQALLSCLALAG